MSTMSEQPQANEPAPEETFDELTGVYGWFRRHQKKLLYTAGLFTLLTFSITGSLQSLVGGLFLKDIERGTIEVNGTRAQLTAEDYEYGGMLSRSLGRLPPGVILGVKAGEGGDSELAEVLAILRRAAIVEGFEASMTEVDKAIEFSREQFKVETTAQLATRSGFSSTQEFRILVAEALRIGMYQRLQVLAADTSDAEVMRMVLRNQEKAAYRVAVWDAEKRQEQMIEESKLTDEELTSWLDEQNEGQKVRMGVFSLPRAKLRIAAALFGEGQFDAEQWKDGVLKDADIGADQLRVYYQADDPRWKDEEGNARPFEDESVQAALLEIAYAEQVMRDLNTKLRAKLVELLTPFADKIVEAQADFDNANESRSQTLQEKLTKEKVLAKAETALKESPEDAALQEAVTKAKAESEAAAASDFAEEQRLEQMEAGVEAAKAEADKARVGFDFAGELAKLTEGKSGFVVKETAELLDAEQLADLDEAGLGFGKWDTANSATALRQPGEIGFAPARTSKAVLAYQVVEVDPTPLKPWDELKPLVQDAYFTQKATDEVIEKNTAMKDAILRLAKEQMQDFIKEKADGRQARIDEALAEWEEGVKAKIAEAEKLLQTPGMGSQAKGAFEKQLADRRSELAGKDGQKLSLESRVDAEIDGEVRAEALKHYGAVLDAAAKETGFEVVELGPLPRKLSSRPRFSKAYDKTTQYIYNMHNELDEAAAVGPIYQSRTSHVVVCTSVAPLEAADVTRREFEMLRKNFARRQMDSMLLAAFTQEELAARYQLEKPVGDQVDEQ
ncbi:MAG: hypothetical protein VYA51_03080 [Planctomycetota bacterium]|nr:hypothetical protein [Planctomycetota bacterium]